MDSIISVFSDTIFSWLGAAGSGGAVATGLTVWYIRSRIQAHAQEHKDVRRSATAVKDEITHTLTDACNRVLVLETELPHINRKLDDIEGNQRESFEIQRKLTDQLADVAKLLEGVKAKVEMLPIGTSGGHNGSP